MAAADRALLDRGRTLAKRLGTQGDYEALTLLASMEASDLLVAFRDGHGQRTTSPLEALVLQYHSNPKVGPMVVSMLGRHRSRPLFDVLMADWREQRLPYLYAHLQALLRTDLPGVEPEVLPWLADDQGNVNFAVARFLLDERRWAPAGKPVAALLQICPAGQASELAALALGLDTQEIVDAMTRRQVTQARSPLDSPKSLEVITSLSERLAFAPPWYIVSRTPFTSEYLGSLAVPARSAVSNMLKRRDEREQRWVQRTQENFAYWSTQDQKVALRFIGEGFDVNGKGPQGTPLQLAIAHADLKLIKALVDAGADPNSLSLQGAPLLNHVAALSRVNEQESLQVAELLLAKGALIHSRDARQATALHQAVIGGSGKMATLLMDRGADVNAQAKDNTELAGLTPTQLAHDLGNEPLAAQLRARGGAVNEDYVARRARQKLAKTVREVAVGIFLYPLLMLAGPMH